MDVSDYGAYAASAVFGVLVVAKAIDLIKNSELREALKSIFESDSADDALSSYANLLRVVVSDLFPSGLVRYKRYAYIINFRLVSSMLKVLEQASDEGADSKTKKSKTIVGLMLGEKMKKTSLAQAFLFFSLVISLVVSFFVEGYSSSWVAVIVGVLMGVIHIDHFLIDYRIKNGWYGKNEFESMEIIRFIIAHANKDDFNDSGGLKRVIPLPDIGEVEQFESKYGGVVL
ncbi:hypothetical protein ALP39_200071 [Pseudomonas marginalis pv. marginalis]|nr:hypothetical protein ALP39_200071 [Pseudomonas marginalis pv. marginalis]